MAGSILAAVALAAWIGLLAATPPDPFGLRDARAKPGGEMTITDHGVSFDLDLCSHCSTYVVAGRGLLDGHELPEKKVWFLLNLPALAAAAKEPGRRGTAEVPLVRFVLAVAAQWFALGAGVRLLLHYLNGRQRKVRAYPGAAG